MVILHIETSTNVCSVALSEASKCIFKTSNFDGMNHAALLSLFIEEALSSLKKENKKLDAVAVSSGPGSYTGLRIGVSTAKGLCYGLGIPLIAVSTLETMTQAALLSVGTSDHFLFAPMIDARRMEVYTAFYDTQLHKTREISADIIDENSYRETLASQNVYFFGNGAEKCKAVITHPNAHFIDNIVPLAENMIPMAERAYAENCFEDVAYFEPFYLKEFYTTATKKNL